VNIAIDLCFIVVYVIPIKILLVSRLQEKVRRITSLKVNSVSVIRYRLADYRLVIDAPALSS